MRARRAAATLMAVAALATGAAACGDDDSGDAGTPATTAEAATTAPSQSGEGLIEAADAGRGKVVFTANCGGCHTLADAGTTGAAGPNLDDLAPDESIVGSQVQNGGGAMPSFEGRLTQQEINDVAKYVSEVAGG